MNEKMAIGLLSKYLHVYNGNYQQAKSAALITCTYMMSMLQQMHHSSNDAIEDIKFRNEVYPYYETWREIKNEIKKL